MKKKPEIFLKHILDNINLIENSTKNLSREKFKLDRDIIDANVRRVEIIGEAVKNLPQEFKNKYPNLPWRDISGARDKIIHQYFGVNLNIVWDIFREDLPKLKRQITKILKEFPKENEKLRK